MYFFIKTCSCVSPITLRQSSPKQYNRTRCTFEMFFFCFVLFFWFTWKPKKHLFWDILPLKLSTGINGYTWMHSTLQWAAVPCWLFVCPSNNKTICSLAGCGFLHNHCGNEFLTVALYWECCDGHDSRTSWSWAFKKCQCMVMALFAIYTSQPIKPTVSRETIAAWFLLTIRDCNLYQAKSLYKLITYILR